MNSYASKAQMRNDLEAQQERARLEAQRLKQRSIEFDEQLRLLQELSDRYTSPRAVAAMLPFDAGRLSSRDEPSDHLASWELDGDALIYSGNSNSGFAHHEFDEEECASRGILRLPLPRPSSIAPFRVELEQSWEEAASSIRRRRADVSRKLDKAQDACNWIAHRLEKLDGELLSERMSLPCPEKSLPASPVWRSLPLKPANSNGNAHRHNASVLGLALLHLKGDISPGAAHEKVRDWYVEVSTASGDTASVGIAEGLTDQTLTRYERMVSDVLDGHQSAFSEIERKAIARLAKKIGLVEKD